KTGKFEIYGILDTKLPVGATACGVKVLGDDNALPMLLKKGIKDAFIAIGSIGDCAARKRIDRTLKTLGFRLPVIVHPNTVIGNDVILGEGTFVAAGAVINPCVRIGRNAIINTSSSIDHDCVIGDFVHIAPGTTLSGSVKLGDEVHVGTGSSIVQKITVGEKCFVKAGSMVSKDLIRKK
ncbi:MAG: acetyltransferase, partial [Candidatus Omnitrophica bacterium]|nr:acetyltransferase [Candidatus Omnitrophota bacterium]